MSKVRQTAAFVAPMSSAATTTSFSASASIATGHHSAGHGAEPGEAGNDLSLRDRSNCARASKTWNRNSPCGVVVSICSVCETCPRVFSVTAARHCPTAAGAVLGGIRWLPLSGVLALSAYATKMGRSLVPANTNEASKSAPIRMDSAQPASRRFRNMPRQRLARQARQLLTTV
jgi:hypothetical protein